MLTQTLPVLAVLIALVALSEWLARRTWMRHLGAALSGVSSQGIAHLP